jgi:hypothetical protein
MSSRKAVNAPSKIAPCRSFPSPHGGRNPPSYGLTWTPAYVGVLYYLQNWSFTFDVRIIVTSISSGLINGNAC